MDDWRQIYHSYHFNGSTVPFHLSNVSLGITVSASTGSYIKSETHTITSYVQVGRESNNNETNCFLWEHLWQYQVLNELQSHSYWD